MNKARKLLEVTSYGNFEYDHPSPGDYKYPQRRSLRNKSYDKELNKIFKIQDMLSNVNRELSNDFDFKKDVDAILDILDQIIVDVKKENTVGEIN